MNNTNVQKPCIVETTQGFSVSYKERLLYSKYNPSKNIIKKIQDTDFAPGSIILCLSPVLFYGLPELMEKIPSNCIAVLCEKDSVLYDFSRNFSNKNNGLKNQLANEKVLFPKPEELSSLPITLYNLNQKGKFRRIIPIDFSAGTQFNADFYAQLTAACTQSIMTFWKNRVTLTKFGRKYSMNFFRNLSVLAETTPISGFIGSVQKPILCFGAGESVDLFFGEMGIGPGDRHSTQPITTAALRAENFFVLCVDSALPALQARGIAPDGIFIEEAQSVILKSFLCPRGYNENDSLKRNKKTQVFAGLSCVANLPHIFDKKQISYFFTEFTNADFLRRAEEKNILPEKNRPFGSVGLTMVHYALRFRRDEEVPVYVMGLDFSYSAGRTHARGTPSHTASLISQSRLKSVYNLDACFGAQNAPAKVTDKKGNDFYATPALLGYRDLFENIFANEKNLFDVAQCGLALGIPCKNEFLGDEKRAPTKKIATDSIININADGIKAFLLEEKNALQELRALLSGEKQMPKEERLQEIERLASAREYLFLHYPDGLEFNTSQSFLNRIRTEIDFFLKVM